MAQVIVRNLDDAVVDRLKRKAQIHGHSLEQELRDILHRAAVLTKEEKIAYLNRVAAMTPKGPRMLAEDLIREDRDR